MFSTHKSIQQRNNRLCTTLVVSAFIVNCCEVPKFHTSAQRSIYTEDYNLHLEWSPYNIMVTEIVIFLTLWFILQGH